MKLKSLQKLIVSAIMLMWGGIVASAQTTATIAFPNVKTWTQGQSLDGCSYTISKTDIAVSFSKGDGGTNPVYDLPASDATLKFVILNVGNTMSLTTSSYVITKVTITYNKKSYAPTTKDQCSFTPEGNYDYDKYVWTGQTTNLVLKNLNKTDGIKIQRLAIEYETPSITISSTPDDYGFYKVGACTLTNDNKNIIEETNLPALDMTEVTLDENVTALNLKNPNTVFCVAGTVTSSIGYPTDEKWTNLGANVVVDGRKAGAETPVYTAATDINLIDKDGCPVLTGRHAGVNQKFKITYTRTIKANAWATSMLPGAVSNMPFDAYIVDAENSTKNNVVFKKVTEVAAYTPFLIHNTTSTDIDWNPTISNGKNTLDMRPNKAYTIAVNNASVNLTGTFNTIPCDGSQYALTSSTTAEDNVLKLKKFGGNAKIGAFRAYFTSNNPTTLSAVNFSFIGGNPTDVEGLKEVLGVQRPANVYNINGQVVKTGATTLDGLDKGIYLFNGKKYVVK